MGMWRWCRLCGSLQGGMLVVRVCLYDSRVLFYMPVLRVPLITYLLTYVGWFPVSR